MVRGCQSFSLRNSASRATLTRARLAPVVPLLQKGGLHIIAQDADSFILAAYPDLIVKDCYWRWPERHLAGNAIDFCVQVLSLSFHDAMCQIHPVR
jgi:hypothetical protein